MRMRLKGNKVKGVRKRVIVICIIIVIGYIVFASYKNVSYYYLNYSEKKAKDIIDVAMGKGITTSSLKIINSKDLYRVTKNDKNEITMIDYDSYLVNLFLKDISNNISIALDEEEKDIAFYVPMGTIFKNPLLNSKGPKLPVRIEMLGSVTTNIETKVKDYGINNSLIEMYIHVVAKEKVMLPIISSDIKIENNFPISYKIIAGKVPNYYGNGISKSSGLYFME